jgi:WD40 repeat protein/serine/threonine protein kinase
VAPPSDPGPDDPRVIAALEEYASALRAGQAPDRESFQARHPEIAGALADCLQGLEWIQSALPRPAPAAGRSPTAAGVQPGMPLGDYRIVREIGRGGMGVVFEAEQVSLNRRVALKVLPLTAALDARVLQRFKNEAQAAAHLHHTHIVPVHATGCEGGIHYYAMQLIEGQSLAQVIAHCRLPIADCKSPEPAICNLQSAIGNPTAAMPPARPSFPSARDGTVFVRTAAALAVQAAEALDHAHQLGVVHRDIKPGNLMVDVRGNLWVTDFGLAHLKNETAALTSPGDLLGTLRYMSPEQALAKRVPLDHRTDIYSLGVTLYELLTLEPAFDGRDQQELLRQIATEEPCPPRRRNRSIPPELETVVLKAIAKEPAERYATAQELADDLRRFLEDRPVLARRPTLWQCLAKCARRHRGVVWAGIVLLVALAIASTISVLLIAQQRDLAEARRREADDERGAAVQARKAAEAAAAEAKREAAKANAVNTFLVQSVLGAAEVSAGFPDHAVMVGKLDIACRNLDQLFAAQPEAEAAVRLMVGELYYAAGELTKAEPHLRRGLQLREALRAGPLDPLKAEDAETLYAMKHLGTLLRERGAAAEAEALLRRSRDALRRAEGPRLPFTVPDSAWTEHLGPVVFSPDSRRVLAGGDSCYLRLLDVATGIELHRFVGHTHWIHAVALSPDGRRALSGSADRTVRLWDVATARELGKFEGHTGPVVSVGFSPDGRQVLSGGADTDKTIRLWDVETRQEVRRFEGHTAQVSQAVFTPDGRRVLSGSYDGTVRLWDVTTGREIRRFLDARTAVYSVAVSPDGRRALSAGVGAVRLWDVATGEEMRRFPSSLEDSARVVFAPDGRHALRTDHFTRKLRLWNVDTGNELKCFTVEMPLRPEWGAISPDGRWAACGIWRGAVFVWRLTDPVPPDQEEREARQRLETARRDRGPDHPDTLTALHDLAALLCDQGKPAEAERLFRQNLAARRRTLGPDHVESLFALRELAALLREEDKAVEAEALLRRYVEDSRRVLGPDHPDALVALADLGALLEGKGRLADAEPLFRQRWEGWLRLPAVEPIEACAALRGLTRVLTANGKVADLEAIYRREVERRKRTQPADAPFIAEALQHWGVALLDTGDAARAVAVLDEALPIRRAHAPDGHPDVISTQVALGWALTESGRAKEAEKLLRDCLAVRRESLPAGHWLTANAESLLGGCLTALGKYEEAEPLLLSGWKTLQTARDVPPARLRQARERLLRLYKASGRPKKAAELDAQTLQRTGR